MIEINSETSNLMLCVFNALRKISQSDFNFEVPLSLLSPSMYLTFNPGHIEDWVDAVMSELFEQTIISESEIILSNSYETESFLKERNESLYYTHLCTAQDFFSQRLEIWCIDAEDDEEEEYVRDYFYRLDFGKVTFKSSLFTKDMIGNPYIRACIPLFVVSRYDLECENFIAANLDDNLNFTIWYLNTGEGEFKSEIPCKDLQLKACRALGNMVLVGK